MLWQNGGMTDLGTLGSDQARAYGINDLGQVVGGSNNGSFARLFWWSAVAVWLIRGTERSAHVDGDSTCTVNCDGSESDWSDAYPDLQDALGDAQPGDQVWVRGNTQNPYRPALSDRYASFVLENGVELYGGFAGTSGETLQDRDWRRYETVLSGDLNGNDGPSFANNGENSFHVVYGDECNSSVVLDGFTITGGNADYYIVGNILWCSGGGLYIVANPSGPPEVKNCKFVGNTCYAPYGASVHGGWGGGAFVEGEVWFNNCVFEGNEARVGGGIMADTHP